MIGFKSLGEAEPFAILPECRTAQCQQSIVTQVNVMPVSRVGERIDRRLQLDAGAEVKLAVQPATDAVTESCEPVRGLVIEKGSADGADAGEFIGNELIAVRAPDYRIADTGWGMMYGAYRAGAPGTYLYWGTTTR